MSADNHTAVTVSHKAPSAAEVEAAAMAAANQRAASAMPKQRRLNIVVLGKSGVGKSSFLNYAAGRNVFSTGVGEPVTSRYFESVEVPAREPGVVYALYDTKGLESGNADEWLRQIFNEVSYRDTSPDIYQWFHTILFCISAGDKRVESFELDAIRKLRSHGRVIVLLTKSDQASAQQLNEMTAYLRTELGDNQVIIPVCNGADTRMGHAEPSGLEDVLKASLDGLWDKAVLIVPELAVAHAMSVHVNLVLKPRMHSFLTLMALTGVQCQYIFPGAINVGRIFNIPPLYARQRVPQGRVPAEDFDVLADCAGIKVKVDDGGMLIANVMLSPDRVLWMPPTVNRADLRYSYFRKAIEAWERHWSTAVDEMIGHLERGVTKRDFISYVTATYNEISTFYHLMTGRRVQPVDLSGVVAAIDEMARMLEDNDARNVIDRLSASLSVDVVRAGNIFRNGYTSRLVAYYAYNNLSSAAASTRTVLIHALASVTAALREALNRARG